MGSGGEITLTADQAGVTGGGLEFFATAVDTQGRILAAGAVGVSGEKMVLARFNPDGTLDSSFGTAGTGIVTKALNGFGDGTGLSLTADGHILVTGLAADSSGTSALLTVWRFNPDGTSDSSFGTSGHAQVASIANDSDLPRCFPTLQPDGALVAGCQWTASGGSYGPWKLTRLNPDGTVDTSFGSSGFITGDSTTLLTGLALAPDGGFFVSELDNSTSPACYKLRRFLADGSTDSGFNGGAPVSFPFSCTNQLIPLPLAVQPDGKVVVSGNNGISLAVGRYLADGTPDSSFGSTAFGYIGFAGIDFHNIGGNDYVPRPTATLFQSDGKIIVSGYAAYPSGSSGNAAFVTRLDNDAFNLTPAIISFTDQTNVDTSATVTSNAVTISGLSSDVSVPVRVSGGQYKINSGAWTNAPGLVQNGDQVAVRMTSSSSYDSVTTATLTVGGETEPNNNAVVLGSPLTAHFTATTKAAPHRTSGGSSGGGGSFGLLVLLALLALSTGQWALGRRQ